MYMQALDSLIARAVGATIVRPSGEAWQLLNTLEELGEVTTHLSTIGMTIVKGR